METKHGLPEEVIFCKKCVISNQRPNTSPEYRKKDSKIGTIGFKDGVCDACRYYEMKQTINWKAREEQLVHLLNRHRRSDGRFDVIVPGSGGKDSIFVAHTLKYKHNMHPLTVTWSPHYKTIPDIPACIMGCTRLAEFNVCRVIVLSIYSVVKTRKLRISPFAPTIRVALKARVLLRIIVVSLGRPIMIVAHKVDFDFFLGNLIYQKGYVKVHVFLCNAIRGQIFQRDTTVVQRFLL